MLNVVDDNGCSGSKGFVIASIDVLDNENTFINIFPNPVNDFLKVAFEFQGQADYTIEIRSVLGETLFSISEINNENLLSKELDVSTLKAGIYFLTIDSNAGRFTKQFIKQ